MYDVMAIGNALVDHEYLLSDKHLAETGLEKSNMSLASFEEQQALLNYLKTANIEPSKLAGGGSAANAMFAFASLGGKAFYACRVGDDESGTFYLQNLHEAGVATSNQSIQPDGVTGSCVVAVTPDAERTMQTYLGTSSEICEDNIDFEVLTQSNWLYLEGYLAMSESLLPAMNKLRQQAGINNVKIALSFSDPAVVKFAKEGLDRIIGNGVEVIFCNIDEAKLYTGKKQLKAAARALTDCCRTAIVTDGANGAVIAHKTDEGIQVYEIPTPKVLNVVDTNGAGDNYSGAFLYALVQRYSLPECGHLASEVASQIIQQVGPRLEAIQYQDIARRVLVG